MTGTLRRPPPRICGAARSRPGPPPDPACPAGAERRAHPVERTDADAACRRAGRASPSPRSPGPCSTRSAGSPGRAGDRGLPRRTRPAPDCCRRSSCSRNSTRGAGRAAPPPEPCCGRSTTACVPPRSSTLGSGGSPSPTSRRRASTCASSTPRGRFRSPSSTCSSRSCGFAWEIDSVEAPLRDARPGRGHLAASARSAGRRAARRQHAPRPNDAATRRVPSGTCWTASPSPRRCPPPRAIFRGDLPASA